MAYTIIIFNATDAWGNPVYSFKINLVSQELSVEYTNINGGVTTNGIKLNANQYQHIKLLTSPRIFENYRDDKWKMKEFLLDPHDWEAQFLCDDGNAMLTLKTNSESHFAPPELVALVRYVMKIGTFENFNERLF